MRPQFTMEQRNFLALEYHKRKGTSKGTKSLIADFIAKFPDARQPNRHTCIRIWKKQMSKGTVLNCNSKSSPGASHSGRSRTRRNPQSIAHVKAVMDRDAQKRIGDRDVSPVSTARRNALGIPKSSWARISKDLKYHPYKPVYRHKLFPGDLPRRLLFVNWIVSLTDDQLLLFLFSDEANFHLNGHVNSQNIRRYAPLKRFDQVNGGRPEHFMVEKSVSPKLMVFYVVKADGIFGFRIYENETMTVIIPSFSTESFQS